MKVLVNNETGIISNEYGERIGKFQHFAYRNSDSFEGKIITLANTNAKVMMHFYGKVEEKEIRLCSSSLCKDKKCYLYGKGCCRYNKNIQDSYWAIPNIISIK